MPSVYTDGIEKEAKEAKMADYSNNSNASYMQVTRHWSPISEKYAGADALVTALTKGWKSADTVFCEEYWHAGARLVSIYHFELTRKGETMTMPVLSNPYLRRVLERLSCEVLPVEERETAHQKMRTNGTMS